MDSVRLTLHRRSATSLFLSSQRLPEEVEKTIIPRKTLVSTKMENEL